MFDEQSITSEIASQANYDFYQHDFVDDDDDTINPPIQPVSRKLFQTATPRASKRPATAATENSVQVYLRVRPLNVGRNEEASRGAVLPTVRPENDTVVSAYAPSSTDATASFNFTRVFGADSSQEDIFTTSTQPLINTIFSGRHALIFAYGITCSGKTFTMQGTETDKGILPRALDAIFARIEKERLNIHVEASYLEIYNESVNDLLDPSKKNLTINCAENYLVSVKDLTEERINNVEQAFNVINRGIRNRQVGATALNKDSSRSHSVFNIILKYDGELYSKLSIVDLAGAERSSRTGITGKAQSETNAINLSLSTLNNCLEAMRKGTRVPYRDSNLTKLFKDVFSGTGALAMICNVNPSPSEFDETMQSLQYAAQAKNIKIRAKVDYKRTNTAKKAPMKELISNAALENLEKSLQERDRTIEQLKDDIMSLKQELVCVEERVAAEKERTYQRLSEEKDAAHDTVVNALEEKAKTIQRRMDEEITRLKLKHTEELAAKHEIDTTMISVRIENAMRSQYDAAQQELQAQLTAVKRDNQAKMSRVAQLESELQAKNAEIEELLQKLEEVESDLELRRSEVEEWEHEYDNVTQQALEGVEKLKMRFEKERQQWENDAKTAAHASAVKVANLESQLSDCMANNSQLAIQVDQERCKRTAMEQEITRLKALLMAMEGSNQSSLAEAFGVRGKRKSDEGLEKKATKTTRTKRGKQDSALADVASISNADANLTRASFATIAEDGENDVYVVETAPAKRTTRTTRARATVNTLKDEELSSVAAAPARTTRATAAKRKALQMGTK